MQYDLGFFDHETGRVECAPNPFEVKVIGWSLPSPNRIDVPKWICNVSTSTGIGAPKMKTTAIGFDLAKNVKRR